MSDRGQRKFESTQWSLVYAAGGDDETAREALESLCARYWLPVYAFVRRHGHDPDAAEDLTQAFFVRFIEKRIAASADHSRGRFRSYLLTALRNFLENERAAANAVRRGRDVLQRRLETAEAEIALAADARALSPQEVFEKRWALSVLDETLRRLRAEWVEAGRSDDFALLAGYVTGMEDRSYGEIASLLGMSEGSVRIAVHRLRKRFGLLLRESVSATVSDPSHVDGELRELMRASAR